MANEELLESLSHLHDELEQLGRSQGEEGKIDPRTRAALSDVADELRRLLDPEDDTTADDVDASSEGVRGYLLEFEAEHPRLAEALGRLADGLANMGI
ncbi:MAG: DUF4404 family protein [Planctomycetota bacterium]